MILVALLAAALQAAPPAPPPGLAPPITVIGRSEAAAKEAAKTAEEVQAMYDQSCAAREYGAYDDLCNQLDQQVREAKKDADRKAQAYEKAKAAQLRAASEPR